jgi:hypothetical protein
LDVQDWSYGVRAVSSSFLDGCVAEEMSVPVLKGNFFVFGVEEIQLPKSELN